ncbi:MAG TPA: tetratricopeptide repeat protein [Nitrososphaeraceae archaeon]
MSRNKEKNPEYWINMGYSLTTEGKDEQAKKYYKKALELDPKNLTALVNLAKGVKVKDLEDSKKHLLQAIEINSSLVEAWINLGVVYGIEKNKERELECFNKAIELDPGRPEAWHDRGRACKERGMYNLAVHDYDEALRLKSDRIGTLYEKSVRAYYNVRI